MFDIGLRNYLIKDYVDRDEFILNSAVGFAETDSISTLSTSVNWLKELIRQFKLKERTIVKEKEIKKIDELEISFNLMDKNEVKAHHIWIVDTGTSCCMTISNKGFIKTWEIHGKTQGALKNEEVKCNKMGNWKGRQYNIGNENVNKLTKGNLLILENVLYTPSLRHNLFSITKGISDGGTLNNENNVLKLTFEDQVIKFNHVIKRSNGYTMAALIEPIDFP